MLKITKEFSHEPKARYGTGKVMRELSVKLNLPFDERMQDWPYEVAQAADIEKYIECYNAAKDDDEKFVLMEMLIQAIEEQTDASFDKYWDIIQKMLEKDFWIHEYTIWYWCCFQSPTNNYAEDALWKITPFVRELWNKHQSLAGQTNPPLQSTTPP